MPSQGLLLLSLALGAQAVDLFTAYSGVPGFPPCFRQPILQVLNASHLLAFAEGRYNGYCSGGADGSNSSVWVRRSADGGATWAPAVMLYDAPPQPDYLSCAHDARSGRAFVFIQTAPNMVVHSDDAGLTWSRAAPLNISLPPGVTASPGVAHGIQVQGALCAEPTCGGAAGRLVVAWVCHRKAAPGAAAPPPPPATAGDVSCVGCYSCLATSDNGGATWRIAAAAVTSQEGSREASIVQLPASSHPGAPGAVIYVTQRNMGATPGHRWHSLSLDSGSSLSLFGTDPGLPDVDTKNWTVRSGRQRALPPPSPSSTPSLSHSAILPPNPPRAQGIVAGAASIGGVVVVSTPMSATERADLALFRSHDNAVTWAPGELLVPGPAGYSDLMALNDTHGAVVCENGEAEFAEKISFLVVEK